MIKTWKIQIPQLTGTEQRRAYVYVPNSYKKNRNRRYPVLYMFDGHNVFWDKHATYGKSWGMKEFMDLSQTEMIIAAVECNHSPDGGRLSEYSPFDFQEKSLGGDIKGRGKITMDWLVGTFKREIDRKYPTLPDREHTFIAGSSMGGLMSLYGVLSRNDVFSRAAALSPSVWFAKSKIEQMIKRANLHGETVIYMDYGSRELDNHESMRKEFANVTKMLLDRGVYLNSRIVPGGEHCEASWERQIPYFMSTLLDDMQG